MPTPTPEWLDTFEEALAATEDHEAVEDLLAKTLKGGDAYERREAYDTMLRMLTKERHTAIKAGED